MAIFSQNGFGSAGCSTHAPGAVELPAVIEAPEAVVLDGAG